MEPFWVPRGAQKSPEIDKKGYQNLTFFWKVSQKASRRGSGAKRDAKTIENHSKNGPTDANRARGKSNDFEKENTWKTELESTFWQKGVERAEP